MTDYSNYQLDSLEIAVKLEFISDCMKADIYKHRAVRNSSARENIHILLTGEINLAEIYDEWTCQTRLSTVLR